MVLKNKEDDEWIFKVKNETANGSIIIENKKSSKTDVLVSSGDGKVDLEKQLWTKGENETEGYYTLKISDKPKVLTAISLDKTKTLQMQGNIPLKWIQQYLEPGNQVSPENVA